VFGSLLVDLSISRYDTLRIIYVHVYMSICLYIDTQIYK